MQRQHSVWVFILFPAIAMLLGWGLRGYIGGGPYGAMIPGCYVSVCIALLLGYKPETAAMVAVFGTAGIAIGGEMTYGQTLGLVRESDTFFWGVLGCAIKGGVWGLLGGALLGLGLTRDRYDRKSIIIGLILMVVAFHVGREIINEPKLIYFSNREDRPRDESWAGLLFGATALLAYMRSRGSAADFRVPFRFALYGLVGGAIGFGVGCLFLAFGPAVKWIGWWKVMEFFFGFSFGAALGLCAYQNREELVQAGQSGSTPGLDWFPVIGLYTLLISIFVSYIFFRQVFSEEFLKGGSAVSWVVIKGYGVFIGYAFVAAAAVILGMFSLQSAWQLAIAVTFFHCVFDYTQDLDDVSRFGFVLSLPVQWLVNLGLTAAIGWLTFRVQQGTDPIRRLLLLGVWSCYAVACVRSFLNLNLLQPPEGTNILSHIIGSHPSIIFVHGTFTVSALITTWFVLTRFELGRESATPAG
jgi:hypothetical protein